MSKDAFDELNSEARAKAFTLAGERTQEAIGAVRDAIAEAVADGSGVRAFTRRVRGALETSPLGPGQLENVFRTNVATAYSAGLDKIAEHPIVQEQFPYEEVLPIRDTRLTSLCDAISHSGIHGTAIYRRDDPVYRKFRSPRHYQDRCGRRLLSVREAAARGVKEAQQQLRTGNPPALPAWVREPELTAADRKMFEEFRGRNGMNFSLSREETMTPEESLRLKLLEEDVKRIIEKVSIPPVPPIINITIPTPPPMQTIIARDAQGFITSTITRPILDAAAETKIEVLGPEVAHDS